MTVHAHTRFTRLSLSLVALLLSVSTFRVIALTEGDYTYTTNSAGQATITDFNSSYSGALSITNTLGGCPVTSIGEYAFSGCPSLTSITIPASVTNIGWRALRSCSSLTNIAVTASNPVYSSIDGVLFNKNKAVLIKCPGGKAGDYTIPNSVTVVGEEAFHECRKLTWVTIPTSVTNLVGIAFDSCSGLTSIAIPESVINLGAFSFAHCSGLTSVTIPDSVASIGSYALYDCSRLTNVVIGSKVVVISSYAFMYCPNLMGVYFKGNAPSVGSRMFDNSTNVTVYRLSTSTSWPAVPDLWCERPTAYWDFGFYSLSVNGGAGSGSYTNGQQVAIAANPPATGYAFSMWTGATQYLSSVTSSTATVTMPPLNISLTATYTNGLAPSTNSGDYIFFTNNNAIVITEYIGTNGTITVPAEINGFPVRVIASNAFASRTFLLGVEIPDSVTNIGNQAFISCANLASVAFGTNLLAIGAQAFDGCAKLAAVTIPKSVLSIGLRAFRSCNSLSSIAVDGDNPNYSSVGGVLFNKDQTKIIQYPGGKTGGYAIPSGVTVVGYTAFQYCYGLTSITIPDSTSIIEESAFYGCSGLSGVNLIHGLGTIGNQSFRGCSSLRNIIIPGSVTSLVYMSFSSCNNITSIYFQGNAPVLGASVFDNSNNLTIYRLSTATGWPAVPDLWGGRPTALWGPIYFTLTVNGGTGGGSFSYGQQIAVTANAPQTGYCFHEWTGATQHLSNVISPATTVTMPPQDIALTATYVGNSYAVTFSAQDGSTAVPASKTVTFGSAYGTLAATTRPLYVFVGWFTNSNCTGSAIASNTTVAIAGDHTLYAKWTELLTSWSPVPVPYVWLNQYPLLLQVAGGNYEAASLIDTDLDGHLTWEEYVTGTVPTDKGSIFRAKVEIADGVPEVRWSPDLGSARVYTVQGKTNITDAAWGPTNASTKFFRVKVDMP